MVNKNILFILMLVVSMAVYAQQDKSLKFGIELDGKLKKGDPYAYADSPTGAVYVGAFAELHLTGHFSGKLNAGLNNTYLHQDEYDVINGQTGDVVSFPAMTKATQTLEISVEPRYYFFSTEQSRKVNLFAALPVMFETKSLGKQDYIFRSKLMIVPTLGCRYDFTGHWGIEASGGLGWNKYGKYMYSLKSSAMGYGLSVGIRYTF